MKTFETPVIEVIAFTAESIMAVSSGTTPTTPPPTNSDRLPWA